MIDLLTRLSEILIPITVVTIVCYGMLNKVPVFDVFVEGAKDGFKVVFKILPTLIGLMIAIGILRSSGVLDQIVLIMSPFAQKIGMPAVLIPITIMRTISASATTGLVLDLFKTYGPDSMVGRMASIMLGCTETIFYTMSIYYMTIKVKDTRYTLAGALLVTGAGIVASILITYWFF